MTEQKIIGKGTWIDKLAYELVEREKQLGRSTDLIRVESGLGASGIPHIGSLGDAVRAYGIKLALENFGYKSELIAYSDDLDGLRKIPEGLKVDADNIGVYRMSMKTDRSNFNNITPSQVNSPIDGPRGSSISFKVAASVDLATSDFLFNKAGAQTMSVTGADGSAVSVKYIDSTVRVTGVTTGFRIDIPIRFIKSPS